MPVGRAGQRRIDAPDLLEVAEDREAREVERLGDLLGRALDEKGAALLEPLDDLHLLVAGHGRRGLAHLVEDGRDHAGEDVADVAAEDLLGLGSRVAAERVRRRRAPTAYAGPGRVSEMSRLTPRMPIGRPSASRRVTASDLRILPSLRGDVETHVGCAVGIAQGAQHLVGRDVAEAPAGDVAVLDRDDRVRDLGQIVEDDLAVGPEHLGQAPDQRHIRPKLRIQGAAGFHVRTPTVIRGGPVRDGPSLVIRFTGLVTNQTLSIEKSQPSTRFGGGSAERF